MRVHMGVDIEAPPEAVWPYLIDPEKTMQWFDSLEVFEYTNGGPGADATFYWEEVVRGKTYSNHFRTTEYIPNRLFAYEMTESSFFKSYTERWVLEPTPKGCRFSFDDNLVFPYGPFGRVMGWFGERMAKTSGEHILGNLKRLVEDDVAGSNAGAAPAEDQPTAGA